MSDPFKREVYYEWVVEWCDKYEDIIDLDHADKFSQFTSSDFEVKYEGGKTDVALQRKVGCDADGMTEQAYAYVVDGKLPDEFDSGHKVPQQYKNQLAAGPRP